MQYYPQYTLQHIFIFSFNKGGLTHGQFTSLFEHGIERENNKLRFAAAIQGIDLDKEVEEQGEGKKSPRREGSQKGGNKEFLFKHPSEYENMTQEEREAETEKIMGKLKGFFGNKDVPMGM